MDGAEDDIILKVEEPNLPYANLDAFVIEQKTPWEKAPPLFVSDLSGKKLDVSALSRQGRKLHDKRLERFSGEVYLIGSSQLVSSRTIFTRHSDGSRHLIKRMAENFGKYANDQTGLKIKDGEYVIARERISSAKFIEGSVFLGTPDESDNYGMWIHITIPSVDAFLANRTKYSKFFCYCKHEWQKRMLLWLGVPEQDLIVQDRGSAYFCTDITMFRYSHRDLAVLASDRKAFGGLVDTCRARSTFEQKDKIFISRRTKTEVGRAYRGLTNEVELLDSVERLGFSIIEPELLSFDDQVSVFSRAKTVVGLGGAAMFNTVYCEPGTTVVTVESGTTFIDAHTTMFASVNCPYGVILGLEDETDPRPSQKRWSVDVQGVIDQIESIV